MSQTLLVDFAVPLDPRDIKAAGYVGVIRYIAPPDAKYDWKRLTAAERDGYWENGLGIIPIFESYNTRAREGAAAGTADANTYLWQLHQLGWPGGGLPLLMADDVDSTADQVRPYFRAAAQVAADAGCYGGIHVVDPLLADGTVRWAMQACAWSGQSVSQTAHLYQRLRPTTPLGAQYPGEFDEDVLLHPIPMWLPTASTPAPAPQPQPAPQPVNPTPAGQQDLSPLGGSAVFELVHNTATGEIVAWSSGGAWWPVPNTDWAKVALADSVLCGGQREVGQAEWDLLKAVASSARSAP